LSQPAACDEEIKSRLERERLLQRHTIDVG
jgi:hypothetical protein